jgi:hypothetical protein
MSWLWKSSRRGGEDDVDNLKDEGYNLDTGGEGDEDGEGLWPAKRRKLPSTATDEVKF